MSEFTLRVDSGDEFTLPHAIAGSSLTLAEIGAATLVASLVETADQDVMARWFLEPEFQCALKGLQAKGLLSMSLEGSTLSLNFAFEKLQPFAPPAPEPQPEIEGGAQ